MLLTYAANHAEGELARDGLEQLETLVAGAIRLRGLSDLALAIALGLSAVAVALLGPGLRARPPQGWVVIAAGA